MSVNPPALSDVEGSGKVAKQGSAWVSAKQSERNIAIQAYASDPKYKKYTQQVEKCLNSFDNVHEWADCIAFLKQLLKTFESYTQFKEIPRKLIVAKRLAQCLNPALPTGVHQRALAVYTHILSVLGAEGLRRDLNLWSAGLFPFFEYAATSVKPILISIYDTYYLPLQSGLRPVMKSFILALLPGLEEETGEFFDMVLALLDRLAGAVSLSFFFQNIWLVMLTTPSARGTSLNFLARRLPQLNPDEDITEIVGKDMGLMIRAFAAALEDENLLVRRAALDILLQSLKVNSHAFRKAQKDDRMILMRAATGVVLRRDLSLNRRLYNWLLGHDEKSEVQVAYLKEHALDLLSLTLKLEMTSPSNEYSESRPFKIFISLLDKWEIGGPLTDVLAYDAFNAAMHHIKHPRDNGEDLSMTANSLYEAVEPRILWKHIFHAIVDDIKSSRSYDGVQLAKFILKTFSQDEEIESIHLPIVFVALLELLDTQPPNDPEHPVSRPILDALELLDTIAHAIKNNDLIQQPDISEQHQITAFQFAMDFFNVDSSASDIAAPSTLSKPATLPLKASLTHLISLSTKFVDNLLRSPHKSVSPRDGLDKVLSLVETLSNRMTSPLALSWQPSNWLSHLLSFLDHEIATFAITDRVVSLSLSLHRNQYLEPRITIDKRPVMEKMLSKLLKYLHSDYAEYHVRAVALIWSLDTTTTTSHVEAIVSRSLTDQSQNLAEAYEAFGVLWRLSEDNTVPGFKFKVPLMLILDALKSSNPTLRRIAETWMRCSLKTYLRVLDPVIYDLLDPSIARRSTTFKVRGREIQGFSYERLFDQRLVNYVLETLLSVVNFGGQGFSKAARSSNIKRSPHSALVQRVNNSGLAEHDSSYLGILIEILLRFVQSEPHPKMQASMQALNTMIQGNAAELLQLLVTRGELEHGAIEGIEAAVIGKLYLSIHANRLDLQNKWLHLLHSVISVATANLEAAREHAEEGTTDGTNPTDKANDQHLRYPVNPLLIQTLIDGISVRSNKAVMQHWLDFVLMAVPQFQPSLQSVVAPLSDCLCRQLLATLSEVNRTASLPPNLSKDQVSTVTDAEFIMLLNGLERLILLGLAYTAEMDSGEEEASAMEKSTSEPTGLLGIVSNVFGADMTQTQQTEQLTSRSPAYRTLDEGIRVLYTVWASLVWTPPATPSPRDETLSLIFTRSRLRCRRVLEHLFRVQSAEVFESIVDWWSRESQLSARSPDAAFELIDILFANAQNAVHMVCESILLRISAALEKTKKQAVNPNLTDIILFKFMEQYLHRLEGPLIVQVWGRFVQLLKEIVASSREFKPYHLSSLRCLAVLADKITQTTAVEDKRVRKDLQEYYVKLLDTCVVYVGKSTDQGSWIRRSTKEAASNGRESPAPRPVDEKSEGTAVVQPEAPKFGSIETVSQINAFISSTVLPNLRKVLNENDKYRPMDLDDVIVKILEEMTRIPVALKSWKTAVSDLFGDNRVFNGQASDGTKWKVILKTLFDSDKTAFPELLGKISTATSANIFANREYEMLLRSLNLRRVSYILFVGEKNHFLTQLPTIQEKLVDTFRTNQSPVVQSEVFLCLRVLLCRLSPHNLTSFWPVLITEMYRIFEQTINSLPADGSEDLQLVLAACKCLDLLLVLQTEEFQVHQWIFVTDTVDAVYRPDDWHPEALMDQLAEVASTLPVSDSSSSLALETSDDRPMRKPLLTGVRQVDSIRDLVPFLSTVSLASYESIYASSGNVDWDAVEKSILDDMFDGR